MNGIVMPVHEQLNEENKDQLFSEVKEAEAKDANENQSGPKRKFTVSEMWSRHRQGRSASDMIRRWNLN